MRIHRHFKFTWFISIVLLTALFLNCDGKKDKGAMYEEFDGVLLFYQPQDKLL